MRYFPYLKAKWKETNQAPQDGQEPDTQRKNYFYVLQANKGANPE